MAANPQRLYMTTEQYLAFDRASDTKYEYLDGEAVAQAQVTIRAGHDAVLHSRSTTRAVKRSQEEMFLTNRTHRY